MRYPPGDGSVLYLNSKVNIMVVILYQYVAIEINKVKCTRDLSGVLFSTACESTFMSKFKNLTKNGFRMHYVCFQLWKIKYICILICVIKWSGCMLTKLLTEIVLGCGISRNLAIFFLKFLNVIGVTCIIHKYSYCKKNGSGN